MQPSRWVSPLALATMFTLMSCNSSPPPTTPRSSSLAVISSVISGTAATNDSSIVTYTVSYSGTHQYYRVYVDSDGNAGSGFAYGGIGAEFLLENANLYRYTGSGGDWSWSPVATVTFSANGSQASWTVARSELGEADACHAAANLVFDIDDGTAPIVRQLLTPASTCAPATGAPDAGAAVGALRNPRATNDAINAQYAFAFDGAPAYFRVYVDTDANASTGFAAGTGVGAEYLLEGSDVYRYVGPGWKWTPAGSATFSATGGAATWSVARALTGETAACGQTATLLFQIEDANRKLTSTGAVAETFTDAGSCTTSGAGGSGTPSTATGGSAPPAAGTGGTSGGSAGGSTPPPAGTGGTSGGSAGGHTKYVFVIAMENEAQKSVYGNSSAPYINQLISQYAHAMAFTDPLPDAIPSEPHYVWMEAGTNAFSDTTFTSDADPDGSNSTASTAHLVTQMMAASPAVSWLSFQEGLNSSTGACPISSSGFYAAKHDPFVFFQDIAGRTPSASATVCVAHHRAYTTSSFAAALSQGTVAQYNFITPNVCNDMHGGSGCPSSDVIGAGDSWLASNLPPIIQFANANSGVIFLVWDEPEGGSPLIPFVAIGPQIKAGYASAVTVTHSALVKTVERIFGLPMLSAVAGANDLGDLFQAGVYP
jgi:phosphatidylinositol-3-phosphatase